MSSDQPVEQLSFLCRHCGTHSRSDVIATERWIDDYPAGPEYRYRLVRCTACLDISLLLAMLIGWDGERSVYDDDFPVYPASPRNMNAAVPKTLQSCLQEARACYQVRAYAASAIMCRRALALLAIERGVRKKSLAGALAQLKEEGDIDQRLYDWCNALRLAGNQAAHDRAWWATCSAGTAVHTASFSSAAPEV